MTERLIIQTPWAGAGTEESLNQPKLTTVYSGKYEDITRQVAENIPPDSNVFSMQFECDLSTAELIQADPDYYIQSWETI